MAGAEATPPGRLERHGRRGDERRDQEACAEEPRAEVSRSICPYCGVGCGQLVFHKDGKLINIEGDPESPISRGHLCPKGADTFQLHTHPGRLKTVKYRRPYSREWEQIPLEQAMDMIAERVWESRARTFEEKSRRRQDGDAHARHCAPGRRDARQRRELPDQEAVYRPAWE